MLLNTRFYVDSQLNRQAFYKLLSDWLSSSDNYDLSLPKIDFDRENDYQVETNDSEQKAVISNYKDRFVFQLVVAASDENATYTTNFVLDDVSEQPSLHVSQDKVFSSMSVHTDSKRQQLHLPNLLKTIFYNELGGDDNGLMTDNKPFVIRKRDVRFAADIINNKTSFLNPVVYISCKQSGLPAVNTDKIAQELMGQAHVLVEGSPLISNSMRELCSDENDVPSDGNIKIILPGGASEIFKRYDTRTFEYDVINSVRRSMASVAIADDFNIIKLKQKHMLSKLADTEDKELYTLCEQMLEDKDQEIGSLKKQLFDVKCALNTAQSKANTLQDSFDANSDNSGTQYALSFDGDEVYDGEIIAVVLKVLQKEYDSMKADATLSKSRKFDVLGGLLAQNFPCTTGTELEELVKNEFRDGTVTREGIGHLQSAGFVVTKRSGGSPHYKICRKGFEKYAGTIACTPSDHRGVKNSVNTFCNTLFGY